MCVNGGNQEIGEEHLLGNLGGCEKPIGPQRVAWNNQLKRRDVINVTNGGVGGVGGTQISERRGIAVAPGTDEENCHNVNVAVHSGPSTSINTKKQFIFDNNNARPLCINICVLPTMHNIDSRGWGHKLTVCRVCRLVRVSVCSAWLEITYPSCSSRCSIWLADLSRHLDAVWARVCVPFAYLPVVCACRIQYHVGYVCPRCSSRVSRLCSRSLCRSLCVILSFSLPNFFWIIPNDYHHCTNLLISLE